MKKALSLLLTAALVSCTASPKAPTLQQTQATWQQQYTVDSLAWARHLQQQSVKATAAPCRYCWQYVD